MKKITQKFIGLFALIFSMVFNANSQENGTCGSPIEITVRTDVFNSNSFFPYMSLVANGGSWSLTDLNTDQIIYNGATDNFSGCLSL